MSKLTLGILAHVDAGKTTLSEALLYTGGQLKKPGRVDHQDAFLDTHGLERERGITIFSKQARLAWRGVDITLMDTPGHVDFSAEMERTLGVLDGAILVVGGGDGVQGHTRTLWRLLERYRVPTVIFVNKMDLPGADRAALLGQLRAGLDPACVDFGAGGPALDEQIALCDEAALEEFLESGALAPQTVSGLVGRRRLFPCFFGSALRLEGIEALLNGLAALVPPPEYPAGFAARVYKIARDPQGARLTYLKVTGGSLRVKDAVRGGPEGAEWEEKVDQIRLYSGARYTAAESAGAGTVCAVTGLGQTFPGQGLGAEPAGADPALEPVLAYEVLLPEGSDPHAVLPLLRQLEEEDPQLRLTWREGARQIGVRLMGRVQLEVLRRLIHDRFGLAVDFGPGRLVCRETIAAPVIGVGHFEPLRHYAEVHLLLEPAEPGSGLRFASACGEEVLEPSWQRLVLTHLAEREHLGVLTGSPITDMRITLLAGRAHVKHTEGGDFRQATYRAVRQGLMQAESVLLEPWYAFELELPVSDLGRALADIQRMQGQAREPRISGGRALLTGGAPVAAMGEYALEVAAYTRGQGRLALAFKDYRPCADPARVAAEMGYDSARDVENTADSVFCSRGAGFTVRWDRVREHQHVDSGYRLPPKAPPPPEPQRPARLPDPPPPFKIDPRRQDKELEAIYERTYGPIRPQSLTPLKDTPQAWAEPPAPGPGGRAPEYLLVDGYNILFAWEGLREMAREDMGAARQLLLDLLCNYQGVAQSVVIVVFDAYRVPGGRGEVDRHNNIFVVYTQEAETADAYIEKVSFTLSRNRRVRVATSDSLEQLITLGHGAQRLSAQAFYEEAVRADRQIADILSSHSAKSRPSKLRDIVPEK